MRLAGKIGVVTGAARGIGEGIARAMSAQGATIYVCDRDVEGATRVAGEIGGTAVEFDVTRETDWKDLAERVQNAHGQLNILVHNAGTEVAKPLSKQSLDDVRRVMSVNLEGPITGSQTMQPLLAAGGKPNAPASIINISSIAGLVGQPDISAYSVSKAAIAHLSKVLAVEFASQGHFIRVNSIFPGCIMTPMLKATVEEWVAQGTLDANSAWDTMANSCPMGKIGDVEDIAMGAVYLASDESKFVTGTSLIIDGGRVAR
jgi:NAD(P)-dependent dehydrogenase (short-subunit alcohol dehydrogenase family)